MQTLNANQNWPFLIPNQIQTSKLPISFGYTVDRLPPFGQKRVTRRCWKESHANKFLKAYKEDRWVKALNKSYYAHGHQIGWVSLTAPPYLESLSAISQADCAAEGYPELSPQEFRDRFFRRYGDREVWVIEFDFLPFTTALIEAITPF